MRHFVVERFLRADVGADHPDAPPRGTPCDERAKTGSRRFGDVLEHGFLARGNRAQFCADRLRRTQFRRADQPASERASPMLEREQSWRGSWARPQRREIIRRWVQAAEAPRRLSRTLNSQLSTLNAEIVAARAEIERMRFGEFRRAINAPRGCPTTSTAATSAWLGSPGPLPRSARCR